MELSSVFMLSGDDKGTVWNNGSAAGWTNGSLPPRDLGECGVSAVQCSIDIDGARMDGNGM